MKYKVLSTLFILATISCNSFAADNVAKVIIMRGLVKVKLADGTVSDVKTDQSLPEGATIQTADKSFVKLLFIDKSQMNLGPNSQMVINSFPKKEAGIITLVKGQIRSQVTKDYMEMDDKSKSKLYIKTKTAAMGIRGTDFQVNFNPQNLNTSLITFEGKVAMAHIEKDFRNDNFDQKKLENVVSGDKAVIVTRGQISAVNLNVAERAMEPTKLAPKQIEALESNETGMKESVKESTSQQFRNPIPPGTEGSSFSNSSNEMDKEISKLGINVKVIPENKVSAVEAEGFFNAKSGEYKLPAGSIVDLNTINIIPPPVNAVFDKNSGTYTVPETFGKVDKVTGEYKAPIGLQLDNNGQFKVIDAEAYQKAQSPKEESKEEAKENKKDGNKDEKKEDASDKKDDKTASTSKTDESRAPASVEATAAPIVTPPNIFAGRPEATAFIISNSPVASVASSSKSAANIKDALVAIVDEKKVAAEVTKQRAADQDSFSPRTKVKFNFDAK